MKEFSQKYFNFLTGELAGINLTAIRDFEEFHNKQILDSIKPLEESRVFQEDLDKTKTLLDIGFGGGFPIIPISYLREDIKSIGIESRNKKAQAVTKIADHLGLINVKLVHSRVEDVLIDIPVTITLKAVGTAEKFLPMLQMGVHCKVFFYKAKNFYELEGKSLEKLNNWKIVEEKEIVVPGTEKRLLICFENKNVLRGTSKKLVKLSSFL